MSGQGGSKEFSSLLFTPRTGDKQGLPDYRSPKPTRSPSTQGYGRSRSHAEGATPRRRSLTPSASMKESLPPPPPSQSMLDSPAGAAPSTAMQQPEASSMSEQSGYWGSARGAHAGPGADDNVWVTVFGFQLGQLNLVMKEFAKCGDIVHVGNGREDNANWVHIQYANKYGAQRALQRNGELVSRQLMVGVQPLEGRMRSAALGLTGQQQEAASSSSLAKPTSALPSSSQLQPQLQPMRPYRIEAPASQESLLQASRSTLSKVSEFVFGL